jgi:hypothetical protein
MPKHPPMPPRVARIKRDIETGLDYRRMANGGRAAVLAYARQCGYEVPGMLVLEWSREFHRTHRPGWIMSGARPEDVERYRIQSAGHGAHSMELEPVGGDLDRWADDKPKRDPDDGGDNCDPDDDPDCDPDDEAKRTTKLCPACQGAGRDATGGKCSRCQGKGRVKLDADDVEERRGNSCYGHRNSDLDNWSDWEER